MKYVFTLLAQIVLCISVIPLQGVQSLDSLDTKVYTALEAFNTPGIAIGVVVNEQVILAKGYGLRDVEKGRPVTENTLFALASATKPFTSFLLGLLVDEGKISWDDPVQMYIPEFRFINCRKFRLVTIRDLLSHCSGLPSHDMLWYNASLEREELIERMSFLEMNCAPGSRYQYNNMVFTVAGMVYERVTGESWEEGIKKRLLDPLSMKLTNSSVNEMESYEDFSFPYVWTQNGLMSIPARPLLTGPSSSMNSSVSDMCNWLQLLLNGGVWKGKQLISNEVFCTLITPQIEGFPDSISCFEPKSSGLGWKVGEYAGHPVVYHGGVTEGFVSLTAFLPNQNIGVVILCNTNSAGFHLIATLTHTILHRLLGLEEKDWIAQEKSKYDAKIAALPVYEKTEETATYFRNLEGHYENPAYGDLELLYHEGYPSLIFHGLEFGLKYKGDNTFSIVSLVPAYPQFVWNGEVSLDRTTNTSELLINFEPYANPIVFSNYVPVTCNIHGTQR